MTLVLRRLDRLGRADDRVHRDIELLSASFAVFVRLWFAHTPSLREEAKPAAREDAESRYQQFKDYVAQEFMGGRRFWTNCLARRSQTIRSLQPWWRTTARPAGPSRLLQKAAERGSTG